MQGPRGDELFFIIIHWSALLLFSRVGILLPRVQYQHPSLPIADVVRMRGRVHTPPLRLSLPASQGPEGGIHTRRG